MNTLFIDLASHSTLPHEGACIACVDDNHTKTIHFIDHRVGDDGLLPAVEHVLASAAWTYGDLSHIACVVGPGGFTSLRMAVSLANVLADQLKIPAAGIHLSDVYALRVSALARLESPTRNASTRNPQTFVWLHSTKRTQMFAKGFGEFAEQFPEATLLATEDLQTTHYKLQGAQWCGELIPEHQKAAEEAGMKRLPLQPISDVLPGLLAAADYTSDILHPWYGRGW